MNIGAVNHTNPAFCQEKIDTQAKLPTGAAAKETINAFEKVISRVGASMSSTDVSKGMNGISEGISQVEEALKADAQAAKANLKALFNKLSGAEAVELDENGFDINDIDDEELVTVVDRIKIMLAAYNENYQAFAGAFDQVEEEALENSAGAGLSARVAMRLEKGFLPATEENITDVISTMEMAEDVEARMPLTDEAKAYLIGNELEPTMGNLYLANHSTVNNGYRSGITEDQWEQIKPQVSEIIRKAGLEETEKTREDAKWLIANELPVTGENLLYKNRLDGLTVELSREDVMDAAVDSMTGGSRASQMIPDELHSEWKDAAQAIRVVNQVSFAEVNRIVSDGRKLTIHEMLDSMQGIHNTNESEKEKTNLKTIEAYRVVCEARVLMTASSVTAVMRQGIDIYSEDLENLVDLLHEEETRWIQEQLTKNDVGSVSEADLNQTSDINQIMQELMFTPCAALGDIALEGSVVTIRRVQAVAFSMQKQYEVAGEAYETMSTRVRSDMGDSVKAAMENSARSILSELGYEENDINLRAIRILAYNGMDMTKENVNTVKNLDSILNNLMDNMSPKTVYQMLKDGINPMETDIETLNQYVNENYNTQDATVKYSEFLYKLEHTEGISDEERRQYIGIYKLFHMFKKDGGKAVGALIQQNAEISLKNLAMAVDSRKRYGMDVSLDENSGMAEISGSTAFYQNLFSGLSKSITPAALKKTSEEKGNLADMTLEQMAEELKKYKDYDQEQKEAYYSEMLEEAREYENVEDNIMRLLTDSSIPVTFYNVMAAKELMNASKAFRDMQELKDEAVEKKMMGILDGMENQDAMEDAYEELKSSIRNTGEQRMEGMQEDAYLDIRSLKDIGKTVNLISALSKKQQYFIPFATEDGVGSIRLKVIKSEENAGKMEMTFATETLGNVYAEFMVGQEKARGYIVTDRMEAVEILQENVDNIQEELHQLGINETMIQTAQSNSIPEVSLQLNEKGAPPAFIYKAAKVVLTNLVTVKSN